MPPSDVGAPAGPGAHERERRPGRRLAIGDIRRERLADERGHRALLLPRDRLQIALERFVEEHGRPLHMTYDSIYHMIPPAAPVARGPTNSRAPVRPSTTLAAADLQVRAGPLDVRFPRGRNPSRPPASPRRPARCVHRGARRVLTEIVANALDSGAARIRLQPNPADGTLTVVADGRGMQRRDLAKYHDVAASTKARGEGIGFAGVGIKLGLLVSTEVTTETRRGATHVATRWHLASRYRAPWKWIAAAGPHRSTRDGSAAHADESLGARASASLVVGDDLDLRVADREGRRQVDGVERPQQRRLRRGGRFEERGRDVEQVDGVETSSIVWEHAGA